MNFSPLQKLFIFDCLTDLRDGSGSPDNSSDGTCRTCPVSVWKFSGPIPLDGEKDWKRLFIWPTAVETETKFRCDSDSFGQLCSLVIRHRSAHALKLIGCIRMGHSINLKHSGCHRDAIPLTHLSLPLSCPEFAKLSQSQRRNEYCCGFTTAHPSWTRGAAQIKSKESKTDLVFQTVTIVRIEMRPPPKKSYEMQRTPFQQSFPFILPETFSSPGNRIFGFPWIMVSYDRHMIFIGFHVSWVIEMIRGVIRSFDVMFTHVHSVFVISGAKGGLWSGIKCVLSGVFMGLMGVICQPIEAREDSKTTGSKQLDGKHKTEDTKLKLYLLLQLGSQGAREGGVVGCFRGAGTGLFIGLFFSITGLCTGVFQAVQGRHRWKPVELHCHPMSPHLSPHLSPPLIFTKSVATSEAWCGSDPQGHLHGPEPQRL